MFCRRDWLLSSPIPIVSVVQVPQSSKVLPPTKSRSQRPRSGWTTSAHAVRVFRNSRPLSENCERAAGLDLEAVSRSCLRLSVYGFSYGRSTPQYPTK